MLRDLVFQALNNAQENGNIVEDVASEANQLAMFDSDLQAYDPEDLVPFVQEWVDSQKTRVRITDVMFANSDNTKEVNVRLTRTGKIQFTHYLWYNDEDGVEDTSVEYLESWKLHCELAIEEECNRAELFLETKPGEIRNFVKGMVKHA